MVGQVVDSDLGGKSSWESKGPTISFSISFLTDPDEFNMLMERNSLLRNFACNKSLTANNRDELNSIHFYAHKDSMDHIQMYFPLRTGMCHCYVSLPYGVAIELLSLGKTYTFARCWSFKKKRRITEPNTNL